MKNSTFKNLLEKHNNRVFSYAYYILRNREDAEDITQDVFIRLWQNWDRIDHNKVVAWMVKVVHNRCMDLYRQKKASINQHRKASGVELQSIPSENSVENNPEYNLEFTESQKLILSALDTLSPRTREMLLMHYYQGLKYKTISEIMNTKISTIKVAVHRGKRLLRKALEGYFQERVEK
ncbi:sigma-70 family RNA polymerase sigma factor [bacterium]|nr:sigma-70 family RNA polymerase sigma factor [bacterium]